MAEKTRKWIIRDTEERITGPFTTEKILYKIGRGEFSGDESVAYYPGGTWIAISKEPQFYDKLLESLSHEEDRVSDESLEMEPDAPQTQIDRDDYVPPKQPHSNDEKGVPPPSSQEAFSSDTEVHSPIKRRRRKKVDDIELVDTKGQLLKEILRRATVPTLIAFSGVALLSMLYNTKPHSEDRIHLLAPQKNQPAENAEIVKGRLRQGAGEFVQDTFEGYIGAENDLVRAIEGYGKDPEVMALLCMTYLELWPYSYQDTGDLKTISSLVQMASALDPGGIHSSVCRSVDLIVRGRYVEAKSLTESMLESRANQSQAQPIMFYYLKGLLLEGTGELPTSIGYLHSAQQLWPQWTRPYVLEAQIEAKMEKYSDAANHYRRILSVNPIHAISKIELGLIEYKYFNHFERAQQLLDEGLSRSMNAPKETLSRGFFGLAEIALKQERPSKALEYAQRAYSFNSSNSTAKNLIVRLGGVEKLKNTKVKGQQLIFEGDQFFREGDWHAAQAYYKAAFEEDGKNSVAALKAAQCLWKLSFSTEAIDWLNKAIRADPKMIEAYVLMADYHTQRFNFLAAAKTLAIASKINPKSADVFRGFAMVELRRGNPVGAVGYGKRALQIYENDVATQILMAQAYIASGDYRLAYNYAAKAIEIDVNDRKAQTVYAESLVGLQGVDVAVDYLLKLIAGYPLVIDYRLALGELYEKDERLDQAEEVFRQIARIQEKPKEAYIELAKVLKAENKLNEALEFLLKAAVLDPADAGPLFQAGLIYLETRRGPEAMAQFQRVLRTNKLFPLVHYQMGRANLIMNNPEAALEETVQEKAINPNLSDAYLLAAEAHSAMKQYSLCATEYQKSIKLRPQPSAVYVRLAQCYRKSGNVDVAVDMLNHAATREPGLADIYKEQGAIYELKGEIQHAIEAYNQYFVLDPNALDRAQIEQRIVTLQKGGVSPE
jgi:tetratricopeptide (TPR) repeat protein